MYESFYITLIFWLSFGVSIGPFWISVMEAAKSENLKYLYKNYILYLSTTWLLQSIIIGTTVKMIGGFNSLFITTLNFLGGGVILYFAFKTLKGTKNTNQRIIFNYKAMSILSFTNPKVWLTVPAGFLAANYTNIIYIDILIFYFISLPIFLLCFYFYSIMGRKGAKLAKGKISYINALLLGIFGLYLFYNGIMEVISF